MRPVFDPMAQHVYDAALGDFALKAGEEFLPCRTVFTKVERVGKFRLGRVDECASCGDRRSTA